MTYQTSSPEASPSPNKGDAQDVDISFVDILFALVVGEALDVLTRAGTMTAAGRSHLAFAGLLTIMSWIGYHNSDHRYIGRISFDLRAPRQLTALAKFLTDVGLVVLYWLAVRTTEGGFAGSSTHPSWRSSALLALISFGLYLVWDYLSWATPREQGKSRQKYGTRRRKTSWLFAALVLLVAVSAWLAKPDTDWSVTAVNVALSVLVVTYRFTKDMWIGKTRQLQTT
jgi:hypothetical protein